MKKLIALTIVILAGAATTGLTETFNCGHGCSITCPDGGGCIYNHTTGACSTFCNEKGEMKLTAESKREKIAKDAKLTVHFQDVNPEELKKALAQLGLL